MPLRSARLKACTVNGGVRVNVALALEFPSVAVIVAVRRLAIAGVAVVAIVKVAVVDPAGTVVVGGTVTWVSLLARLTTLSPAGGAALSATVAVTDPPAA